MPRFFGAEPLEREGHWTQIAWEKTRSFNISNFLRLNELKGRPLDVTIEAEKPSFKSFSITKKTKTFFQVVTSYDRSRENFLLFG